MGGKLSHNNSVKFPSLFFALSRSLPDQAARLLRTPLFSTAALICLPWPLGVPGGFPGNIARHSLCLLCGCGLRSYTCRPMAAPLKKQLARELAMQILFVWDSAGTNDAGTARTVVAGHESPEPLDEGAPKLALAMATGAWDYRAESDQWIERLAPQWPPRRQPAVDRNILRLAVWEMTQGETPHKVVIDEAIELAKRFSTENSPAFINGVLDSVLREVRSLTSVPTGGLQPDVAEPREKPPEC